MSQQMEQQGAEQDPHALANIAMNKFRQAYGELWAKIQEHNRLKRWGGMIADRYDATYGQLLASPDFVRELNGEQYARYSPSLEDLGKQNTFVQAQAALVSADISDGADVYRAGLNAMMKHMAVSVYSLFSRYGFPQLGKSRPSRGDPAGLVNAEYVDCVPQLGYIYLRDPSDPTRLIRRVPLFVPDQRDPNLFMDAVIIDTVTPLSDVQ